MTIATPHKLSYRAPVSNEAREMEAVGAAASILGILGAAIKSAEVIRELLASVKDGPSHVKELTVKADGLRRASYF
jgi:hypothetical protein